MLSSNVSAEVAQGGTSWPKVKHAATRKRRSQRPTGTRSRRASPLPAARARSVSRPPPRNNAIAAQRAAPSAHVAPRIELLVGQALDRRLVLTVGRLAVLGALCGVLLGFRLFLLLALLG